MVRLIGWRRVLGSLAVMLILTGCATSPPAERDRFFRLEPTTVVRPAPVATSASLQVSPFAARGFVGGRQIVYRTAENPLEIQRHPLHLWESPPALALAGGLTSALREAALFEFVVGRDVRTPTDYQLVGELTRFEHRPTDEPRRVVVAFEVLVLAGRDRQTLFARPYQGEEPIDGGTPEAMISAFNRLTGRLIGDLVRDLEGQRWRRVEGAALG